MQDRDSKEGSRFIKLIRLSSELGSHKLNTFYENYISSYKAVPQIIPTFLIMPIPGTLLCRWNLVISYNTRNWRPYQKIIPVGLIWGSTVNRLDGHTKTHLWPWCWPFSNRPRIILKITAQLATAIMGLGSTWKSPLTSLWQARYKRTPVTNHIIRTVIRAPMTSAL